MTRAPAWTLAVTLALAVAGWWDDAGWHIADGAQPVPAKGGETYSIIRLDQPIAQARGSAPEEGCETNPGSSRIDIPGLDAQAEVPPIAVTGVADLRPRAVQVLNPSAEVYRQAAAAYLQQRGVDSEVQVAQVIRADLDGDGKDEVIVVAERITQKEDLYGQPGDYSVVLLRRLREGDQVDTTLVTETVVEGPPQEAFVQSHRVSAVADLNGDGRMEVVLAGRYYEGVGTTVHELRADGSMPVVMQGGCGA